MVAGICPNMVSNRLGDKKGTNLSNVVRFNEAMKTVMFDLILKIFKYISFT